MGEFVLPAAPNWYCSRVSDCSQDGLFLYGAKNSIFVFDIRTSPTKYAGRFMCHSERVVGVSEGGGRRAVTAGEDGRVRLWDYSGLFNGGEAKMLDEHANHKNKPTVVHWSRKDDDLTVSGDEKGAIIVWHMSRSDVRQMVLEKSSIVCLECSPHNRFHAAVGYRSGLILVVDISSRGVVLQKLRGHDDEVHTVTWCPQLGEDVRQRAEDQDAGGSDESPHGCLLASGGRDRTLRIWSSTRGRCLLNFKVLPPSGRREKYEDQKVRVWLAVKWVENRPLHLITSTQSGDLLCWDLCRPGKQKFDAVVPQDLHKGHNRIVFNISSPGGAMSNKLVSISMDRQVIIWDVDTLSVEAIQALGGYVYCLTQSPLNPARLAVGVGDNMIRVWNTENPKKPYDCASYWQGLKSKVTALSWHPEREGFLVFGTDDGRVGVYDVTSNVNRPPRMASTFHKRTVYVVTWGPPCGQLQQTSHVVYSCGDGKILVHDFNHLEEEATNLNDVLPRPQNQGRGSLRSEISWKQDFSAVAIGNDDGSIDVYSMPGFAHVALLQVHRKLVNVIRWHPIFTGDSVVPSPYQHWLATGSNEPTIHVFNLEALMETPPPSDVPLVTDSYISLEGHSNRITGLAWSNHGNGLLASASYDGSAQVWRLLPTVEGVANFRGHTGRLLGVAWSPEDPDLLYSGGDDFSLLTWRISAQTHRQPPQGSERKKKSKSKQRARQAVTEKSETETSHLVTAEDHGKSSDVTMEEIQVMLEAKRRELTEATSSDVINNDVKERSDHERVTSSDITDKDNSQGGKETNLKSVTPPQSPGVEESPPVKRELREPKKRRAKSLFPVFSNAENRRKGALQEECVTLATVISEGSSDGYYGDGLRHLGMYSSRRDMYQLVEEEASNHRNLGSHEQLLYLDIWSGDLTLTLERAAKKGQLTDLLMAHAASVSPVVWRGLCEKYAGQLERDGCVTKAASYLVSAGHVYKGLDLLQQHHFYKEAVCLARLRLSPHDPLLNQLYTLWAEHLTSEGAYEQAAKCYLAAGLPLEAVKCLLRRYDLSALRAAVQITHLTNETESFKIYGHKYITECQLGGDWLAASQLIKEHEYFKPRLLPLLTHEVLVRQLSDLHLYDLHDLSSATTALISDETGEIDRTKNLPKFLLDPEEGDIVCPWKPHLVGDEVTVLYLLRLWLTHTDLDLHHQSLRALYQQLSELRSSNQRHRQPKQILLDVSLDVTLGIICLLLANTKMAAYWWVGAMVTCQQTQSHQISQGLCRILLPQGRVSLPLLQQHLLAVKTVLIDDVSSSRPASLHLTPAITVTPDLPDLPDPAHISTSSHRCSSIHCLHAFYSLSCLKYWLETLSGKEELSDSNTATDKAGESDKTLDSHDKMEETHSPIVDKKPNSEQMITLCRALLWEVQVKRNFLQSLLAQIEKVAAEREQLRKTKEERNRGEGCVKESEEGDVAPVPQHLLTCSNFPIVRTLSGEYINMSSVRQPTPTTSPFTSPRRARSVESQRVSEDENMVLGVELEGEVDECHANNSRADILHTVYEGVEGEKWEAGVERLWENRLASLEERYTCETSTARLVEDKDLVTTQLIQMSAHVTSTPFPDPSQSADIFLHLLPLLPDQVSLLESVRKWRQDHAYVKQDVFQG